MTPERLEQVKEILEGALALTGPSQILYIDEACRDDGELKAEVLRLIESGERMGGFLDRPLIAPDPADEPGALTGLKLKDRYELVRFAGRGGFGDVYEARDELLAGRRVAVKVLHQGALSASHLMREIEVLASLEHPGIVTALDAGVFACGRSCLVMRWVEGPTLRQLIREGRRFSPEFVRRMAQQLSSALSAAHAAGVMHLDLKPDNIIVVDHESPEAYAVLVDFGVGRITGAQPRQNRDLRHSASRYTAPELADGNPEAASDFYSLGVVLLELLGGVARDGAIDIDAAPVRWRRLISAMLRPDPRRRIQTSAELVAALPRQYSEMVLWAAAAAAIIIASLTAVVLSRSTDQVVLPAPVPLTSLPDEESHPHLSADGSRVFFAWSQGSANADIYVKLIGAPEPLQLTNHPARDAHPAVTGDGKRLAFLRDYGSLVVDLIIMPAAGGAEVNLGTRGFHSISWSQDGRSIAASLTDSPTEPLRIELLSVNSRRWQPMIRRVEGMRGDLYPAFSPDGRRLAFARRIATNDAAVAVMNLDENLRPVGEPVILVRGLLNLVTPSWTPDGRTILYLAGPASNRSLWAVRADGSGTPVPLPQAGDRLDQIATASNVWRLVASRSMEDFNIWSAELSQDGRRVSNSHPVISNTWNDEEGRISPNGKWLAFVSHRTGSEQIWVSQIDGRRPEQITDFAESDNLRVLWSPDSARLLITGNIGKRAQTFLREYPGGKTSAVHLAQNETACGWSRDGKFVYYSAELLLGAQLWRKPLDGGPARLVTKRPAVRAIESPDGKTVYFCSRRYSDGIWAVPVEGGVEKRVVPSIEFRAFAAGHAGLFYINGDALRLQPHSGGAPLDLLRLPRRSGFGFDICEEAGLLVYTQLDHAGADLVMIDDYRF